MALTAEEIHAFADIPANEDGIIMDPTLLPERYLPQFMLLARAEGVDVIGVAEVRGWSRFEAGRLVGAAQLASTLSLTGLLRSLDESWGGFPGTTLEDAQSGIGVVHNALLLDSPERTLVHGPFRAAPRDHPGRADAFPATVVVRDQPDCPADRRATGHFCARTAVAHRAGDLRFRTLRITVCRRVRALNLRRGSHEP